MPLHSAKRAPFRNIPALPGHGRFISRVLTPETDMKHNMDECKYPRKHWCRKSRYLVLTEFVRKYRKGMVGLPVLARKWVPRSGTLKSGFGHDKVC